MVHNISFYARKSKLFSFKKLNTGFLCLDITTNYSRKHEDQFCQDFAEIITSIKEFNEI